MADVVLMLRPCSAVVVVLAGSLMWPGVGSGASPLKGARYVGTTAQVDQGAPKKVSLRVDRRGTHLVNVDFRYLAPCSDDAVFENGFESRLRHRVGRTGSFKISSSGILKPYSDGEAVGTVTLKGRFTSKRKASGTITVRLEVRQTSGEVVATCAATTTWSARVK